MECKTLKDSKVESEKARHTWTLGFDPGKKKSKMGRAERSNREAMDDAANLARAKFYLHLGQVHNDPAHQNDMAENLLIVMREGRLKP